jgi:hypothetical protein
MSSHSERENSTEISVDCQDSLDRDLAVLISTLRRLIASGQAATIVQGWKQDALEIASYAADQIEKLESLAAGNTTLCNTLHDAQEFGAGISDILREELDNPDSEIYFSEKRLGLFLGSMNSILMEAKRQVSCCS